MIVFLELEPVQWLSDTRSIPHALRAGSTHSEKNTGERDTHNNHSRTVDLAAFCLTASYRNPQRDNFNTNPSRD